MDKPESKRDIVQLYGDPNAIKPTSTYGSFHEALTGNRSPSPSSRLIRNGDVLATSVHGCWELRESGVSVLSEEFWHPARATKTPKKKAVRS